MLAEFEWTTEKVAIVAFCAIPIVMTIAGFWAQAAKARALAELKMRLAEKGMTADEISRVVEAGKGTR